MTSKGTPDDAPGTLAAPQDAEDEKLEMRDPGMARRDITPHYVTRAGIS
jgi:hypothetical protein